MDLSKLDLLSSDTLAQIKERIDLVLRNRLNRAVMAGGHATFMDRRGMQRTMRVERINAKSISGKEVMADGSLGMKWTVHPSLLTPVEKPKPAAPIPKTPLGFGSDAPKTRPGHAGSEY